MANGDTKTEALLNILGSGGDASEYRGCCNTKSQSYILDAIDRVQKVEDDVEEIKNNPDVVDIVATYADLQAYDTQHLTNKDIIRVLQDETHDGESTYYRYNKQSDTWTYIGESKQYEDFVGTDGTAVGEAGLVPAPAATDAGKFLKADGTWAEAGGGGGAIELTSADYDYPDANPNGVALWRKDAGMYYWKQGVNVYINNSHLDSEQESAVVFKTNAYYMDILTIYPGGDKGTYTWYKVVASTGASTNINSNPYNDILSTANIVQTTGTNTSDIMSQNATTGMVFSDDTKTRIKIGNNVTLNNAGNSQYVAIGAGSTVSYSGTAIGASANAGYYGVAIASGTSSSQSAVAGENAVAIGARTGADGRQSVALGYGATASSQGQFDISCGIYTTAGYNSSAYRLLSGLYDGQNAHDAATVGQINATIDAINTALSTNIPHIGAAS